MLPVRMLSILILLFSLCDADGICTTEFKMDPPEIVAEYGGSPVIVNCTTTLDEHDGIYWTVGNEIFEIEDEELFISHSVPVSDWNVTAECKMKLNESYECSKDLKVILFKNPEVVHSVQLVNVMGEETQYRLQCDIINVAPVQFLTVSWYKNNESIRTMSFNDTTTKTPVNESSILRVNISREENVAEFRCEAGLDFGPHGPKLYVSSQTHRVSAHYAPELKTSSTADVYQLSGTNITLRCEAEGNPPPVYNWICDGENMLENTNSLNITRVNRNKTCTCTATNYLGNITKTINVHVEPRGCPLTLTPSETVVKFGDPVSINCSTSARYVEGMGWEAPFGGTGFERLPVVTWRVEKLEEWNPSPSCYATLNDGSQCTVNPVITVYKTPDIVSIYPLNQSHMTEEDVHIVPYNKNTRTQHWLGCNIINVAPVQHLTVRWYKNNKAIQTESFNDTTTKMPVNESSILRIDINREEKAIEFRCEAELDFGPHGPKLYVSSQTHRVSAHYAPEINTSCTVDISPLEGTNITLSCEAEGNPPPVYNWTCDGENMLENTNSLNITRVNRNKTCTCTATNYLGNITKTIHLHVEPRGCPLSLMPSEIVVRFGDPVSINCSTSATDVEGMGWMAPAGHTGFESLTAATWMIEKFQDWASKPSCNITLNDDFQCSVSPVITVYKAPEMVSVTELDNAQTARGTAYKNYPHTQHKLQCDIINVAPVQYLTVSWYKSNERIHTQFFNDTTKTPVNESSILKVNISREENVAEFRCEAKLDLGPHGPKLYVSSQTHRVSAHYAPEKNTKNSTQDIFLVEGTNITLRCEAVGNPPPVYNWTCDGKNMLENTNSLNVTRVKHNTTCTCTATNYLGNITHTINVHVEPRGCPLTLTPSETVVTFGDPVSINCSTSATDVEGMGWEAPFGGTGFERLPVVTWRVEKLEEWTPSPSCYATLVDGSQCTVNPVITVNRPQGPTFPPISQTHSVSAHYAPELILKSSTQDIFPHGGTDITLTCEVEGNPPPVFNWTCDGENMLENTNSLNITRVNRNKTCTCTATNYLGNITKTINVHVTPRGCPLTLVPSEMVVRFEDPVSIKCSTSATDVAEMAWMTPAGDKEFKPGSDVTWMVKNLKWWTPSPFCSITLNDDFRCSVSPVIIVYKTPETVSISELNHGLMLKHKEDKKYTKTQYKLQCDIINMPQRGSSPSREAQTSLSPATSSSLSGEHQGVPRLAERYNLSSMSWVCPGASFWWDMPGTTSPGGTQEASLSDAQTTSTGSFRCEVAAALL
ncbi:zygote arrest protein 1 [Sarotherodon galilaeus]